MENVTTTLQKSDAFTAKTTMDVFRSLKNNVRTDRPTVWLTSETGIHTSTLRSMYCRYKKEKLLEDNYRFVYAPDPDRTIVIRKPAKK